MKKLLFVLAIGLFAACGSNSDTKATTDTAAVKPVDTSAMKTDTSMKKADTTSMKKDTTAKK